MSRQPSAADLEAQWRETRARENRRMSADARKMRRELGMTLRDVAKVAKCSVMYVCDLEHGRRAWTGKTAQRVWATLAIKRSVRS